MSEENIPATPFNFAMIYYMTLNGLIIRKDDAYMQNDIYGYFKGLQRIYNLMYFKIAEKEEGIEGEEKVDVKELNKQFADAEKKLLSRTSKKDIMPILHQVDKKLMVLMNKYKMIFPNIESVHGLDKIAERYKLKGGK